MKPTKKEIEQAIRYENFLINSSLRRKEEEFKNQILRESFLINRRSDNKN